MRKTALLWLMMSALIVAGCGSPGRSQPGTPDSSAALEANAISAAPLATDARYETPRIAFDNAGALHLTYLAGGQLFHQQRADDGSWSAPELLREQAGGPTLLRRPNGEVCALWTGYEDIANLQGNALQMRCLSNGVWSPAASVGSFYAYEPVFAPDGTPHALSGNNSINLGEVLVSGECSSVGGLLAIDPSGHYHAVWALSPLPGEVASCGPGGTMYSSSGDGGKTWSKPELLAEETDPRLLLADKQGRLHLLLFDGSYRQWQPDKGWGKPVELKLPFNYIRATLDANDAIHLVATDFLTSDPNLQHYYVYQNKDGSWNAPRTIAQADTIADPTIAITADSGGKPYFAWVGKDGKVYVARYK